MSLFTRARDRDHDLEIFHRSEAIFPQDSVHAFIEGLQNDLSFMGEIRGQALEFLRFFEGETNRYRIRRLQERLDQVLADLHELKTVTAVHFLVFPRNQEGTNLRHALHPDYFILEIRNVSVEQHEFYLNAERQLQNVAARVAASYAAYRKALRKKLKV